VKSDVIHQRSHAAVELRVGEADHCLRLLEALAHIFPQLVDVPVEAINLFIDVLSEERKFRFHTLHHHVEVPTDLR
jgi:hypothetical protein